MVKKILKVIYRLCIHLEYLCIVKTRGLDLSKVVLKVSVGQKAADPQAVKVGGQKGILPISPLAVKAGSNRAGRQNFF